MSVFTDSSGALEEAEYLAKMFQETYVLINIGNGRIRAMPRAEFMETRNAVILEVINPAAVEEGEGND